MAELKRKDETLTTADLAGRSEKPPEPEAGPQLVRDGEAGQSEPSVASASPLVDDVTQKRNPSSTAVGTDTGAPVGMKTPCGIRLDQCRRTEPTCGSVFRVGGRRLSLPLEQYSDCLRRRAA